MSLAQARGKTIDVGGIATNYHEAGEGQALFLLHGSGAGVSAWENWNRVMPALARTHRVIAPDILGFGLTQRTEGLKFNIKVWVNHFVGLMDSLGADRASVVGNSFGGALALATAISNPHRLRSLILMGTPAGEFQRANRSSSWNYEPTLANMRELLLGFPFDPSVVTDEMVQGRFEVSRHADSRDAYRKLFPKPSESQQTTIVKGIPAEDLRGIEHPVLALHGREDGVVPLECGVRIASNCPNAELHVFGKCGHWVQLEKEQAFVQLTQDFLARSEQ
jgi:2-hydroxy-6-oxo-octa-2,4-dienoate hydrolase